MVVSVPILAPALSAILPIVEDALSPILDMLVSMLVPIVSPVVVDEESPVEVLDALSLHATKAPIAKTNKSFFMVKMIDFFKCI